MKYFTIIWTDAWNAGNQRHYDTKKDFVKVKDVETLMKSEYGSRMNYIFEGLVFTIGEENGTIQVVVINDDGSTNDQKNEDELVHEGEIVKFEKVENVDDIYTIKNWVEKVKTRWFTNYDGFGEFASTTFKSNIEVKPSDYNDKWTPPEWATHVVWYNR